MSLLECIRAYKNELRAGKSECKRIRAGVSECKRTRADDEKYRAAVLFGLQQVNSPLPSSPAFSVISLKAVSLSGLCLGMAEFVSIRLGMAVLFPLRLGMAEFLPRRLKTTVREPRNG